MRLPAPVVVTPPNITMKDGSVKVFNPITLERLDITIMDSVDNRVCAVRIRHCPRPLVLWEKETYDTIGDYTQAQVEARISELLGNNPAEVLTSLFINPNPYPY
jgi:hypothetical protein